MSRKNARLRRGNVAFILAVVLVLILGFATLAIDGGLVYTASGEMQRAADSSALAGASGLAVHQGYARAIEYAGRSIVIDQPVRPNELDMTIGMWDGVTRTFRECPENGENGVLPNAMRVVGTRLDQQLFFARIMGLERTRVRRDATALAGSGHCAGIWGLEGVSVDGSIITDSYDANHGPYGPGNVRTNGDVCSCRDITADGNIAIRGDAYYGENYHFIPSGSSYEVLGVIDDHPCGTPDIDPDYAAAEAENDNENIPRTYRGRDPFLGRPYNLAVGSNDHLTLPPGTYYFDSALIDGQGYIEVTGPTVMYIDGNATLTGGGLVNRTENPYNLIIYARGPNVTLSGGATFYGAIIAPTATVHTVGNFQAYGTVLARILDFEGDAIFHVEEGLVFELFGISAIAPILVE